MTPTPTPLATADPHVESRRRQGLPDRVTDPQVIARIAALLRRPAKETTNAPL